MLGEEKVPLPEGIDWSEALRERDEALLYGDWRSPMPNDMRQAIEWHQRARKAAISDMAPTESPTT